MPSLLSLLPTLVAIGVYVRSDSIRSSPDGARYVSGAAQPTPFHRRFHHWRPAVLAALTYASLLFLGASFGDWRRAAMFAALPGVWFVATRPHSVDAVAMAAAWGSALLHARGLWLPGVACALAGGFVHERAPIYAALYAWHPLPLVGLLAVGWWRRPLPEPTVTLAFVPGPPQPSDLNFVPRVYGKYASSASSSHSGAVLDIDRVVATTLPRVPWWRRLLGHVNLGAAAARFRRAEGTDRFADVLEWRTHLLPLRGVVALAAWQGAEPRAWACLALSYATRLVATDTGRIALWAAPALIASSAEPPTWLLFLHLATFQRMP